uniref:N-acyl amino acid synthase FeeM catalytic core domain-containing protein n=1 Tax=Leptospirillum ferrodiazotrophum TaxID=412449 RepID=C6HYR1_9BACT|nr:MAG: hypothetical protein UBAL3_94240139 [Leptospirillum ferrodiazotrophum]
MPTLIPLSSCEGALLARFSDLSSGRPLALRLVRHDHDQAQADTLIATMYRREGYAWKGESKRRRGEVAILLSEEAGATLGTVTVGEGGRGLRARESYPEEVGLLEGAGETLAEFTGLAILPQVRSTLALARLFHAALLVAKHLCRATWGVIEVNPSHGTFYCRLLGFEPRGETRTCSRVGAPALLLAVDLDRGLARAREVGGCPEARRRDRSLYPLFFAREEAEEIGRRLAAPPLLRSPLTLLPRSGFGRPPGEREPSDPSRSGHRPSVPA